MPEDIPEITQEGDYLPTYQRPVFFNQEAPFAPEPTADELRQQRLKAADEFGASQFGAGFTKGAATFAEGQPGFAETVTKLPLIRSIPGSESAGRFFKSAADYVADGSRNIPLRVPSFTDIDTLSDVTDYASGQIGQALGYIAPAYLFAILTAGMSTASSLGQAVSAAGASQVAKDLSRKYLPGMAAATFTTETGQAFRGIRDETGKEAPILAFGVGGINAALETVPNIKLIERILDGPANATKRATLANFMGDVLSTAGRHAVMEGVTELGQEGVQIIANHWADKTYQVANMQNLVRLTDSFLGGLLGGGVLAGGGRAFGRVLGPDGSGPATPPATSPATPPVNPAVQQAAAAVSQAAGIVAQKTAAVARQSPAVSIINNPVAPAPAEAQPAEEVQSAIQEPSPEIISARQAPEDSGSVAPGVGPAAQPAQEAPQDVQPAAEIADQTQPGWMQQNVSEVMSTLSQDALIRVEDLAAQRKTASEIASATGLDEDLVRYARIGLKIPSQSIPTPGAGNQPNPDFEAWLSARQTVLRGTSETQPTTPSTPQLSPIENSVAQTIPPELDARAMAESQAFISFLAEAYGPDAQSLIAAFVSNQISSRNFTRRMAMIIETADAVEPEPAISSAEVIHNTIQHIKSRQRTLGALIDGDDYTPRRSPSGDRPHVSAIGPDAIRDLINSESAGFSQEMRDFTNRFLEQVDPIYWQHLTLSVVDKISPDGKKFSELAGTFDPILRIAKVMRDSSNEQIIAHELVHNLYYYLPDEIRLKVHEEWQAALNKALADDPENATLKAIAKKGGVYLDSDVLGALTAHHGTPHAVDQFKLEKIGTGEGAQVYGWGLYFAENPQVAKQYADNLGGTTIRIPYIDFGNAESVRVESESQRAAVPLLQQLKGQGPFAAENALNARNTPQEVRAEFWKYFNTFDEISYRDIKQGKEYTVSLDVSPDELLDWDKPLSQQPQIASKLGASPRLYNWQLEIGDATGASLKDWISSLKNHKAASEMLLRLGIKGIRYLDQGSRAEGKGTYNYVIWDESIIKITAVNGVPVEGLKPPGGQQLLGYGKTEGIDDRYYHLTNPEEFFVKHLLGAAQSRSQAMNGVLSMVRDFIRQLVNTVKSWLGNPKAQLFDQIAGKFAAGAYSPNYKAWEIDDRMLGGLATTARSFERNIAAAGAPEQTAQREVEVRSTYAQVVSLKQTLDRIASSIADVTQRSRRLSGQAGADETMGAVRNFDPHTTPATFMELRNTLPRDSVLFSNVLDDFVRAMRTYEARRDRLRLSMDKQAAELAKPGFIKKVIRKSDLEERIIALKSERQVALKDFFAGVVEQYRSDLKSAGISEGRATEILRDITLFEKLLGERAGIGQHVGHIADVISMSAQGRDFLDGNLEMTGQEIMDLYNQLVGPTELGNIAEHLASIAEDVPGGVYLGPQRLGRIAKEAGELLRQRREYQAVSADMLSRMRDKSRDLVNLEIAATNPELFQEFIETHNPAFLKQLAENPQAFVGQFMRSARSLGRREGIMVGLLRVLNQGINAKLNRFRDTSMAHQILDTAMKDPEINGAFQVALSDIGGRTAPRGIERKNWYWDDWNPQKDIPMPDGTHRTIDLTFRGNVDEQSRVIQDAASEITDWLSSDAGQNNPYARWWSGLRDTLQNFYLSGMVLGLYKTESWAKGGWGTIRYLLDQIGTPSSNAATIAAGNMDTVSHFMGNWVRKHGETIKSRLLAAAMSHPEVGVGMSGAERIMAWYDTVGNVLNGRANTMGTAMRVGEEVFPGTSITEQDLAALKAMSSAINEAYKTDPSLGRETVMEQQVIEAPGGIIRLPLRKVEDMLPRVFRRVGVDFARSLHAIIMGKPVPDLSGAAKLRLIQFLDGFMETYGRSFLEDRGKFAAGIFRPSSYYSAASLVASGQITNIDGLVSHFQADPATVDMERDAVRDALLTEMVGQSEKIYRATEDPELYDVDYVRIRDQNSFTSSRGDPLASYFFYDYGIRNEAALLNFAVDGADYHYRKLKIALEKARLDLSGKATDIKAKFKPGSRVSGDSYRELDVINRHLSSMNRLIAGLDSMEGKAGRDAAMDWKLGRRVVGDIVLAAIANPITGAINLLGNIPRFGAIYRVIFGAKLLNPEWAWEMGKEIARGLVVEARGVPAAIGAGLKAGLSADKRKLREGLAAALHEFANEKFLRDQAGPIGEWTRNYRDMNDMGIFPFVPADKFRNILDMPETGGRVYRPKKSEGKIGQLQDIMAKGWTYLGLWAADIPGTVFPRDFDILSNSLGFRTASMMINNVRVELAKTFRNLGPQLGQLYNLDNPADTRNLATLPEYFVGHGATTTNLNYLLDMMKLAGVDLKQEAIHYWSALRAGNLDADLLTREQYLQFAKVLVEEINLAAKSNRSVFLKSNKYLGMIFPLIGWSHNAGRQAVRWFSRASADPKKTVQQLRFQQFLIMASLLGLSGVWMAGQEEMLRKLYLWLYGEDRGGRQPWETTGWESTKRWVLYAASIAPVINSIPNLVFNDTPVAASQGIDLFLQNKIRDGLNYISNAINTGDPLHGLPELTKRTFPITRPIVNVWPGHSGVVELRNAGRLLQRHGPKELRRPAPGPTAVFGATATELTPYGRRMVDAAVTGDIDGLKAIFAEAVEKAKAAGRASPERVVQQIYQSQDPMRTAFKVNPSAEQYQEILGAMSSDERQRFEATMAAYTRGAHEIGARPITDRIETVAPSAQASALPPAIVGMASIGGRSMSPLRRIGYVPSGFGGSISGGGYDRRVGYIPAAMDSQPARLTRPSGLRVRRLRTRGARRVSGVRLRRPRGLRLRRGTGITISRR